MKHTHRALAMILHETPIAADHLGRAMPLSHSSLINSYNYKERILAGWLYMPISTLKNKNVERHYRHSLTSIILPSGFSSENICAWNL